MDGIPDECQPPHVVSSVPPSGIIDARQGLSLSGLTRQGFDRFQIVFDRPVVDAATGGPLTQSSFDVLDDEGTAYPVLKVIRLDQNATEFELLLVDPIQPGRWTLVIPRILSSCQIAIEDVPENRVVVGFLPADVNGDGVSSPGDILELIDDLNHVVDPPLAPWQCDADRSGVCGPPDILRVIDLLNGANATRPWNGVELPPMPE